jgi:peptidoglycan hydrolase-like protein with peptidoglycan-binding domain
MTLKKGDNGENVKILQNFLKIKADGDFGPGTELKVKEWQKANSLTEDGVVGPTTASKMGIVLKEEVTAQLLEKKWENLTIQGSTFPDAPIKTDMKISLSKEMINEYLPALEKVMGDQPKGFKLLCTIMAQKEGFFKGSRSYATNNPGNIGNTDSGANKKNLSLADGILLQKNYILSIVEGKHNAFSMNKKKIIPPYYSPEIAKNAKTYGMSPYLPGYEFVFTGQIDQFVKIYSTGARGGNSYLSMIISYFNQNGIKISPESKIQDIIKID